jgi:hypothetical protein
LQVESSPTMQVSIRTGGAEGRRVRGRRIILGGVLEAEGLSLIFIVVPAILVPALLPPVPEMERLVDTARLGEFLLLPPVLLLDGDDAAAGAKGWLGGPTIPGWLGEAGAGGSVPWT